MSWSQTDSQKLWGDMDPLEQGISGWDSPQTKHKELRWGENYTPRKGPGGIKKEGEKGKKEIFENVLGRSSRTWTVINKARAGGEREEEIQYLLKGGEEGTKEPAADKDSLKSMRGLHRRFIFLMGIEWGFEFDENGDEIFDLYCVFEWWLSCWESVEDEGYGVVLWREVMDWSLGAFNCMRKVDLNCLTPCNRSMWGSRDQTRNRHLPFISIWLYHIWISLFFDPEIHPITRKWNGRPGLGTKLLLPSAD